MVGSRRNATVNLDLNPGGYLRGLATARTATSAFIRSLDSSNDRMSMLVQTGLALGPALAPIGASIVPTLSGLTNQLAFAGIGAGVAATAFAGVGDALTAVNEFALEPTEANLQKLNETMGTLGPAGRDFVMFLQDLRPQMQDLQDIAQAGLFPGMQAGIEDLMTLMPEVEGIVDEVASTMGSLAAEAGENLASPRWREFFAFLESEARPTLTALGRTLGNFTEGLAQMWMAFDPISDQFSTSFLNMSRDFREWATGLDETEGFRDFVDYLARITPKVWDTLGSIGSAMVELAAAAAPVGEVALPIISLLFDTLSLIAESPAGPVLIGVASGLAAISRAVALYNVTQGSQLTQLLSGSALVGAPGRFRAVTAASAELQAAQQRLAASAVSARDAQFAMIPTKDRRQAVRDYSAASRDAAAAEQNLAAAQAERRTQTRRLALGTAGMGLAMSGLGDDIMGANTASYALIGTMFGPWGTAIGAGVGAVKDLQAANDGLASAVTRADQAIASADYDSIVQAMNDLETEMGNGGLGQSVIDFADRFDGAFQMIGAVGPAALGKLTTSNDEASSAMSRLESARDMAAAKAQDQAFAEAGLSTEMAGASQSARDQTEAILESVAAKNAARDASLAAANGEIAFEQALDDAAEAARNNKSTLDINTQAGRDNRLALLNLASSWNALTPAQQNAAGASDRARSAFIDTAMQMGANRREAGRLADEYLDIPDNVSTNVRSPGADAAGAAVRRLNNFLDDLPFRKRVQVNASIVGDTEVLRRINAMNRAAASANRGVRYTAGYGGGQTMADGGLVRGPGGPRDDLVPIAASNGEFVMNAAATARHLPVLMQMNAKKYADGGLVTASQMRPAPVSMPAFPAARTSPVGSVGRLTITNWADGTGHFEVIAESAAELVVAESAAHDGQLARQGVR